ncbi:MAG: gliding motility protein GldN [Sphingobacteriales bacterium]|nr:MAG: gliding motility protein GldN [Sphingobacteriales bacterium]
MKFRNLLSGLLVFTLAFSASAQSNLLNAKTPDEIGKKTAAQLVSDNDKPLPYGYVHDRDIMFGKTVWELIDLDERINFPLYYPIDTANIGKDRRSLFSTLLDGIQKGKITEVYADEYFNTKKSLKDMSSSFVYKDTLPAGIEEINNHYDEYYPKAQPAVVKKNKKGQVISSTPASTPVAKVLDAQFVNTRELTAQDISGYKIKGYWYFDKRQGELKYRILGICPVSPEARDVGNDNADVIELFWIYFPSIRDVLHGANAFNDRNSAMPITFDHLLNARRFDAVIYREENVYGDRKIDEYMKDNAQMQLLESERVKEKIRDFEQDMWSY